ncbi:hypothetical protein [Vibrio albus]|uniref:hypothetical protein n=1 Tax=Vibrio albus TaxID=2200953 RepID=UPI0011B274B6|nr:hypothetical protein [Vibrio albus]
MANLPENLLSGVIHSENISEASGIAVSKQNRDIIWINNDSGNRASVFGVDSTGKQEVQLDITGTENTDWEDLATFQFEGRSYILIADVGDNGTSRKHYTIHIVQEPDLSQTDMPVHLTLQPKWNITFTYPDGEHDCESVAVDAKRQQVLLLSKREEVPILYQLPLTPKNQKQSIARELGPIKPFPAPGQTYFRLIDLLGYTSQPTGMDIAPDGSGVAVLTYGDAYYYPVAEDQNWVDVFSLTPSVISLPLLEQAEGIGFDNSGEHLFIVSEKLPAPLLKIDIRPFL